MILDAGGVDAPIPTSFLPFLSILSPNETELKRLSGMDTSTEQKIFAAACSLMSLGVQQVLVKLGAQGSMLISGWTLHLMIQAHKEMPTLSLR